MDQTATPAFAHRETPLSIGSRVLPSRYFLAPLAGYTQLPFRRAVRELGGLGLATTDLVQATTLVCGGRKSLELVATSPDDRPLSVQIFGSATPRLVEAARWLEARGYGGVDINMGCPMAKVNGQGGGARLMCDVDGAVRTAAQVVGAVNIPVTVKMRLGWDRVSITAPVLARDLEQVGVAAVTVHGRTREQGFRGSVQLDAIRATVEAVEHMPVIGNGDVRTVDDALHMRRITGCAAVAVGRGVLLDPWIFRKLEQAELGAATSWEPTADDQIHFLSRNFELMQEHHDDYACVLFRKFAGWYGARLGIPEDLEDRLRRFESAAEFAEIVAAVRDRHGTRQSATPTALVKVPNGPVERW
jgi:nifR3 family TIM-barrel protein